MPDAYTYVNKPTGSNYTLDNFQGKQIYDDPNVLYDDPNVFYDSVNESIYTYVSKPTSSVYSYVAKPTS